MRIIVADEAGACYGVNRALDMVQKAAQNMQRPIHTLGPLIHNPSVVHNLDQMGIGVVQSADEEPGGTLLLRTHGVTPEEEQLARRNHEQVLDATCPFVIRAHKAAEKLTQEGYQVIVFGESGHPEVLGTLGHAPGALVVETLDDLAELKLKRKVGIVVQTTQARARLRELVAELIGHVDELRIFDTICEATTARQNAAAKLSSTVDVMVVIGGKNSANTCRLAEICQEHCAHTYHVEGIDELQASWFVGAQVCGVTAGASTPQTQIDTLVAALQEMTS